MRWLDALSTYFNPLRHCFDDQPAPVENASLAAAKPAPEKRTSKVPESKDKSKPQVKVSAGTRFSKGGKSSVTGGLSVKSDNVTRSASVTVNEKGKVTGKVGEAIELTIGGHKVKLGATIDSSGNLKFDTRLKN